MCEIIQFFFLADVYFWGAVIHLGKYIFSWQMRFIWGDHLRLEVSCIWVNTLSAKFVSLKNVDQTGTLGYLQELYELHGGFYSTRVCCSGCLCLLDVNHTSSERGIYIYIYIYICTLFLSSTEPVIHCSVSVYCSAWQCGSRIFCTECLVTFCCDGSFAGALQLDTIC